MIQWYITDKKRYEEEVVLIQASYPFMSHFIDENTGNAIWSGSVSCLDNQDNLFPPNCPYNPLKITIECPHDYPKSMPIVYDIADILKKHGCIHIHQDSNKICYGLRCTGDKCNFHLHDRIKDVIEQIGAFIYGQWEAERNGGVWLNDRGHGSVGILQYELEHGHIPTKSLCPCGKNKVYLNCCLKEVEFLMTNTETLKSYVQVIDRYYGRRKECPCGSHRKLKDCCEGRLVFLQPLVLEKIKG